MAVPAEFYDSEDGSDEYGEFSCGNEFEQRVPNQPSVNNSALIAARLRAEREQTIIDIIRTGTLAELNEIFHDPPGFDVAAPLQHDWPPLLHAACECRLDMVSWLLAHDANPNQCVDGKTPLIVALMTPGREAQQVFGAVNVLLNNRAVVNVSDRVGRTPFMYAVRNGYRQVVDMLLKEAALEACDNEGNTVLFHAIECRHVELVRVLLQADVCTDIVNASGATPREWALQCGLTPAETDDLFPVQVEYVVPPEYLCNNTPEALAPTVFGDGSVPPFFFDVCDILRGMRCGNLVQYFARAHVGLLQLLCISDAEMIDIGVPYPFQRNRIRFMLQRFHEREFSPRTLRTLNERFTTADLFTVFACQLKHLLIIHTTFEYLRQSSRHLPVRDRPDYTEMLELLPQIREKIARIRAIVARTDALAEQPVQHIRPNQDSGATPTRPKPISWWEGALAAFGILASAVLVRRCRMDI